MAPIVLQFYFDNEGYIDLYESRMHNTETILCKARAHLKNWTDIHGVEHPLVVDQANYVQKLEAELYWNRRLLCAAKKLLC